MKFEIKKLLGKIPLLFLLSALPISAFPQPSYTLLCDSNGVALPGFYLATSNLVGTLPATVLPTNWLSYQTFQDGTNVLGTNTAARLQLASNTLAAAQSFGTNWNYTNAVARLNSVSNALATNFFLTLTGTSNYLGTNFAAQLVAQSNLIASASANGTTTSSNALAIQIQVVANNLVTTSNGIAYLIQTNVAALSSNSVASSNALFAQINSVSNLTVTSSNALRTLTVNASNALSAAILTTSNLVTSTSNALANTIGPAKAFACTVPANYASIGVGFSTPLMPDGNYSVSLTPNDYYTATAPTAGLTWYVGSKNNSGFTIYLLYATNAYNLYFDCVVKENTQ